MKLPHFLSCSTITKACILTFGTFALLIAMEFGLLLHFMHTQKTFSLLISHANQQRILAQSIGTFSVLYAKTTTTTEQFMYVQQLESMITQMEKMHYELLKGKKVNGSSLSISPSIIHMYKYPPYYIDRRINDYLQHAKSLLLAKDITTIEEHLSYITIKAPPLLMSALDSISRQYEQERNQSTSILQFTGLGIFLFMLVMMLCELKYFVKPYEMNTKRLKHHLSKQQDYLSSFLKYSPQAVALVDMQHHYVAFSDSWLQYYPATEKPVADKSFYEVFSELMKSHKDWVEYYQRCLKGETIIHQEATYVSPDGTTKWVRYTFIPWKGQEEEITGITIFSEDITAHTLSLQQLQHYNTQFENTLRKKTYLLEKQKNMLNKIIEHLPVAIFAKNIQDSYRWVLCNKKAEELFLIKKEDILNKTDYEYFPQQAADVLHATDKELVLAGKQEDIAEEDIVTDNGTWVSHTIKIAIPDEHGQPSILLSIMEDITEKKKSELMLSLYESVIKHTNDSVLVTSTQLERPGPQITYVNDTLLRMTGYTEDELIGKTPRILHGRNTDQSTLKKLKTALSLGKSYQGEILNYTKDRKEYWATIHVFPVLDKNGKLLHFAAIEKDITQRKALEAKLAELQTLTEHTTVAKNNFLVDMAQELRTPLNSILGMLHLLKDTPLSHEQKELAGVIQCSSTSLLDIVNDIIDISRIETNEIALEHIGIDIKSLFTKTIDDIRPHARKKGIVLKTNFHAGTIPLVLGDPAHLSRILNNLVKSAITFSHSKELAIIVTSTTSYNNTILLRCKIKYSDMDDNTGTDDPITPEEFIKDRAPLKTRFQENNDGVGPDPKTAAYLDVREDLRIGKPRQDSLKVGFSKVPDHNTSSSQAIGIGLGLAITKELVERMGGKIGIVNKGASKAFWFEFILETTSFLPKTQENLMPVFATPSPSSLLPASDVHILVAEDHPFDQLYLKKLFTKWGIIHVEIVDSGQKLFELYQKGTPDLILMDCHMQELNGYETTQQIRDLEKTTGKHVPIIAMTVNAMTGNREHCLAIGMDNYVNKPIDKNNFQKMLAQWIRFPFTQDTKNTQKKGNSEDVPADLSFIHDLCEGNITMEKKFIEAFLTSAEKSVISLEENHNRNNLKEWTEALHMFKGGAKSIGAHLLETLCNKAENTQPDAFIERKTLLEDIQSEYNRVKAYLKKESLI